MLDVRRATTQKFKVGQTPLLYGFGGRVPRLTSGVESEKFDQTGRRSLRKVASPLEKASKEKTKKKHSSVVRTE